MMFSRIFKKSALVVVLAALFLTACGGAKSNTFVSKDGSFSVTFPGEPKENSSSTPSAAGDIQVNVVSYEKDAKNAYALLYMDFPEALIKGSDPKVLLENGLQGQLGVLGADLKIEDKKDVDFNGYTGLYAKAYAGSEYAVTKDFLVGNRAYILMIVQEKAYPSAADEKAFLDSFKLLK